MIRTTARSLALVSAVAATLLLSCRTLQHESKWVSLVRLIADPASHNGDRVFTEGFFVAAHEETVLYLTKEHADFGISENAIWIDFTGTNFIPADFNGNYIYVEGTFLGTRSGTWGLNPGAIRSPSRITIIHPRSPD